LAKGSVEAVKNPKFATGVGLVLAGFKSIDDRDVSAQESQAPINKSPQKSSPKEESDFWGSLLKKTKGFLIDDFNDPKKK
jgi:cell division protein FtsA